MPATVPLMQSSMRSTGCSLPRGTAGSHSWWLLTWRPTRRGALGRLAGLGPWQFCWGQNRSSRFSPGTAPSWSTATTFTSPTLVLQQPDSEYPTVDGASTVTSYLTACSSAFQTFNRKSGLDLADLEFLCFHCPFRKMVQKAYAHLHKERGLEQSQAKLSFQRKVAPGLVFNQQLGNIYTGSLYLGLIGIFHQQGVIGKKVGFFSYGSGLASSFFVGQFVRDPRPGVLKQRIKQRLEARVWVRPQEYDRIMQEKQESYGRAPQRVGGETLVFQGTWVLQEVDQKWRRKYRKVGEEASL